MQLEPVGYRNRRLEYRILILVRNAMGMIVILRMQEWRPSPEERSRFSGSTPRISDGHTCELSFV